MHHVHPDAKLTYVRTGVNVMPMPRQQHVIMRPEAVKERRVALGLTQAELARHAHCNDSLIARIEKGERQPGYLNARAIARALGVALTDIAIVNEDTNGDAA